MMNIFALNVLQAFVKPFTIYNFIFWLNLSCPIMLHPRSKIFGYNKILAILV